MTPLSDLIRVHHGYAFPSDACGPPIAGEPRLIRIGDFARTSQSDFQPSRVQGYFAEFPERFRLRPGDLLLAMTCQSADGEILGVCMRVPDNGVVYLHNQRIGRIEILRPDSLDPRFLEFAFRAREFNRHLFNTASGSKILHTAPDRILSYLLVLPPLAEQRRIAGVLGALDDLIETNQRLIANLVRQADAIALQHRVQCAGELSTFGAIAKVSGGGTPSTKAPEFWGGPIHWATPTDMTALPSPYLFGTSRAITQAGLDACSSDLFPEGTILMTSRATIGPSAVTQVPTAVNQGFIVLEPAEDIDRWFVFHEMRRRVPEFIARANGSTFQEISRGVFKSLDVEWPDTESRRQLHTWLEPLHTAGAALQREIGDLRRTRDELLPLLLSGRVSVREVAA